MAKKRPEKSKPSSNAIKVLLAGCLAEVYMILLRRYYINGNVYEAMAWDDALPIVAVVGVVLAGVGLAAVLWMRKTGGWKQECGAWLLAGGLFLAIASAVSKLLFSVGVTLMSVLAPGAALLGILWFLYDRECFYALTILAVGTVGAWACRHGVNNTYWKSWVYAGAVALIALMALIAWGARKAGQSGGKLGSIQVLQSQTETAVILASCGLSAAAAVVSLLSATLGYYAMWTLGIVMFILLVYYTVKQL